MRLASFIRLLAAGAALGLVPAVHAQQAEMTFFVTSVGSGKGADLGGLEGADAHCQTLAEAAGAAAGRGAPISARRHGAGRGQRPRPYRQGPWQNAKGVVIANNVDDLHGEQQPHQGRPP